MSNVFFTVFFSPTVLFGSSKPNEKVKILIIKSIGNQ